MKYREKNEKEKNLHNNRGPCRRDAACRNGKYDRRMNRRVTVRPRPRAPELRSLAERHVPRNPKIPHIPRRGLRNQHKKPCDRLRCNHLRESLRTTRRWHKAGTKSKMKREKKYNRKFLYFFLNFL